MLHGCSFAPNVADVLFLHIDSFCACSKLSQVQPDWLVDDTDSRVCTNMAVQLPFLAFWANVHRLRPDFVCSSDFSMLAKSV